MPHSVYQVMQHMNEQLTLGGMPTSLVYHEQFNVRVMFALCSFITGHSTKKL